MTQFVILTMCKMFYTR